MRYFSKMLIISMIGCIIFSLIGCGRDNVLKNTFVSIKKEDTIQGYLQFLEENKNKKKKEVFIAARDSILSKLGDINDIRIDHIAVFRDIPETENLVTKDNYVTAEQQKQTIQNSLHEIFTTKLDSNYTVVPYNQDTVLNIAYRQKLIPYFSRYHNKTFTSKKKIIELNLYVKRTTAPNLNKYWKASDYIPVLKYFIPIEKDKGFPLTTEQIEDTIKEEVPDDFNFSNEFMKNKIYF